MNRTTLARARSVLLLIVIVGMTTRCYWQRDWKREREFTRALKCHMSAEEVQRLARALGSTQFRKAGLAGRPGIPTYAVEENDRLISLWFDQDGLVAYASVMTSPYSSGVEKLPIVNLCPGITVDSP